MKKLKTLLIVLFPLLGFSFQELWKTFKESWIGEYIIAWISGILIIVLIFIVLLFLGSFVMWKIPTFEMPTDPFTLGAIRLLIVVYSALILRVVGD